MKTILVIGRTVGLVSLVGRAPDLQAGGCRFKSCITVLALREIWESETPKKCPGTSRNQCQEVWDSQLLKIFSHL